MTESQNAENLKQRDAVNYSTWQLGWKLAEIDYQTGFTLLCMVFFLLFIKLWILPSIFCVTEGCLTLMGQWTENTCRWLQAKHCEEFSPDPIAQSFWHRCFSFSWQVTQIICVYFHTELKCLCSDWLWKSQVYITIHSIPHQGMVMFRNSPVKSGSEMKLTRRGIFFFYFNDYFLKGYAF